MWRLRKIWDSKNFELAHSMTMCNCSLAECNFVSQNLLSTPPINIITYILVSYTTTSDNHNGSIADSACPYIIQTTKFI